MWASALAGLGLDEPAPTQPQHIEYLWPCNAQAWVCWQGVQTQWRTGMAGATGLCYAGVRAYLGLQGLPKKQHAQLFAGIQAAEQATLQAWAEQREQQQPANP